MSLLELDTSGTDKGTTHSYLELYEELLKSKKHSAKRVLEIGIGNFAEKNGASIKMWADYFPNAHVYALDILSKDRVMDELYAHDRIHIYTSIDAYSQLFFYNEFYFTGLKFDVLLDDGPHTLESGKRFIQLYSQVLERDGILMIEDLQDIRWVDEFRKVTPPHLQPFIKTYDLREVKGRYDDIVFTIDCRNRLE